MRFVRITNLSCATSTPSASIYIYVYHVLYDFSFREKRHGKLRERARETDIFLARARLPYARRAREHASAQLLNISRENANQLDY